MTATELQVIAEELKAEIRWKQMEIALRPHLTVYAKLMEEGVTRAKAELETVRKAMRLTTEYTAA